MKVPDPFHPEEPTPRALQYGLASILLVWFGLVGVVLSHEFLHCLSGWYAGSTANCQITVPHPSNAIGAPAIAWASPAQPTDHEWSIPLTIGLFAGLVWFYYDAILD